MKVYPSILLQADAKRQPLSGYRVWFLAKDWELGGTGFIPGNDFKKYLRGLGLARSSYSRWIRQAKRLGLFQKAGRGLIKLAGLETASKLAGCSAVERPAQIELVKFIGAGWKSFVWAGFLKNHEGIIARATLQELSFGVPERTQYERERQAGVENHKNYASFGNVKDHPEQAISLYGEPGHYQQAGEIRRRLPNSRTVPECVEQAKKGRIKKVNKALGESFYDVASNNVRVYRLYSDSYEQTKRIRRQDRKLDDINKPDQIFERTKKGVYYAITL